MTIGADGIDHLWDPPEGMDNWDIGQEFSFPIFSPESSGMSEAEFAKLPLLAKLNYLTPTGTLSTEVQTLVAKEFIKAEAAEAAQRRGSFLRRLLRIKDSGTSEVLTESEALEMLQGYWNSLDSDKDPS